MPKGRVRLLSPQHLSQKCTKQYVTSTTDASRVIKIWGNSTKTTPLDPETKVATFDSALGFSKFHAFCTQVREDSDDDPVAFPMVVSDNDKSNSSDSEEG